MVKPEISLPRGGETLRKRLAARPVLPLGINGLNAVPSLRLCHR